MTNSQKVIRTVAPAQADLRKRSAKQGGAEVRKTQGGGPRTGPDKKSAPFLAWEKLAALPPRVLIFGGAAVALVIIIMVLLFPGSARQAPPQISPPAPSPAADSSPTPEGTASFLERPLDQPAAAPPPNTMAPETDDRPTIQSIRFSPPQPTTTDTLKAEVVAGASADPSRITYTYVWKVNNRTVAGATGDTLSLATLKKRDLVTLTVTPYDGDKAGFPVESSLSLIYGAPPSLDLQTPLKTKKAGDPLELQLVSFHPDSESITFSLEPPLVQGMSIDGNTGKITWITPPNQKGKIRFGAAVEDADKTKVTKLFDITMQ